MTVNISLLPSMCANARLLVGLLGVVLASSGCGATPQLPENTGEELGVEREPAVTQVYSDLWGQSGERWTPQSRLPDFAFAGYRTGNVPIPTLPVVANVRSFGAVGDGVADDSQAFLNAIAATSSGAISIPAGRYKITKVLKITKSNVALRGAGVGATTLYFPSSLTEALGSAPAWAGDNGAWSWAGGFLWWQGKENGVKLANVTGGASRGSKTISVDSVAGISVGSTIRLLQFNNDGSLGAHLHAEQTTAGPSVRPKLIDFAVKVTAINGSTLTLERPLRADVRAAWSPQVHSFAPAVQETGVEDLSIEFPNAPYAGHLAEKGYNAIYLDGVANCWLKNVTIWDGDSGVVTAAESLSITRACTFDNVRLASRFRPSGWNGHHGFGLEGTQDMLVTRFAIDRQFIHDMTVDETGAGNVFSAGTGQNVNFDHHRSVPNENLFTDIDVGPGDTLWVGSRTVDSGAPGWGPPSGARETFWNIRASNASSSLPGWPQINVIGMTRYGTQKSGNAWVEQLDPAALYPSNLHLAQLALRMGTSPPPTPVVTTISVSPGAVTVATSGTQQFSATAFDQFGSRLAQQPSFSWTTSTGTIDASGMFRAGSSSGGPYSVIASAAGKSGTASVTVASGSDVSLSAAADAYVRDGYSSSNFGSETKLECKTHEAGWNRTSFVRFDLTGVTAVASAKLRLFGTSGGPDPIAVAVYGATSSAWSETGITWSNQPSLGGVLSTQTISVGTPRNYEWDVTAFVQAEKNAGRTSAVLALKSTTVSATVVSFDAREAGSTGPRLVIVGGGAANRAPSVATPGTANPSSVLGSTTSLSVLGADDGGEPSLKYTWATTGSPPAPVGFSANATNAARNVTASFSQAGSYQFRVTIADAQGLTAFADLSVAVEQVATSVRVLPASVSLQPGSMQQFSANALDQFGLALSPAPTLNWSVDGGGSISTSGLFRAGSQAGGPFAVRAATGGVNGSASVTVSGGGGGGASTLLALADAFVRDGGTASSNFGSQTTLEVKSHDSGWNRNAFLKFDLSQLSSGISLAKLRLFGAIGDGSSLSIQAFGIADTNWLESSLVWNNQPPMADALASLMVSGSTYQWYEWDVTAYVAAARASGRTSIAFALRSATFSASVATFASREDAANAPRLSITSG